MKGKKAFSFYLLLLFMMTGCGYQFGGSSLADRYCSMSVPFVEGDRDGSFTAELVKRVSTSTSFDFEKEGGNLILLVKILDFGDNNIGFRYDRDSEGKLLRTIIPAETRTNMIAEVQVVDANSGEIVVGPTRISAYVDYDHEYYSSRDGVNIFSLGQLTDFYEAHDAMYHPLNIALSQKIVDYINNSW